VQERLDFATNCIVAASLIEKARTGRRIEDGGFVEQGHHEI
jgi:hypothetical protein